MGIRDFVTKKCFYTKPDGSTGVLYHRSVVLDSGIEVRWNQKSGNWKLTYPARWDSAVASSLSRYAMVTAHGKGRLRSETEEFNLFSQFAARLMKLVDVESATTIVMFLKGGK